MNRFTNFESFDLQIVRDSAGSPQVSVLYSPAGETTTPVPVATVYDDDLMSGWLRQLRAGVITRGDLAALGQRLSESLFPAGAVRDLYQRSLGMAEARGVGLRLRLRIAAPPLAALPWEYVFDVHAADFLVLNRRIALVRYHSEPVAPRSIVSHAPAPILLVISNVYESAPLDVGAEIESLLRALRGLLAERRVLLDLLFSGQPNERQALAGLVAGYAGVRLLPGPASIDALRDVLRRGYRVIHYIGHATFDEQTGGALLLGSGEGPALVNATTLAREVGDSAAAVVVLNACKSATVSTSLAFMGIAPALIRAGIPAVIAMQYAIRDSSATAFSGALYRALADGAPLDAAVTEGRKAISAQITPDEADWGIPVLFMRSPDGVIWREAEMNEVNRRDDRAAGDTITGRIGYVGPGAQVAIGKGIRQAITQPPVAPTAADRTEIERLVADLKSQLAGLDAPANKKLLGQEFVSQLETELTKTAEQPDASIIKVAGNWLLDNLPALAGSLASLFLNPIIGKVVAAAGDLAAEWVQKRFRGPC